MPFLKRLLAFFLILILLLAAGWFFLPWRPMLAERLSLILAEQGMKGVQLQVGAVGPNKITLTDITTGGERPTTLNNLGLDYEIAELLSGRLQAITLSGLTVEAREANGAWQITGFEPPPATGDAAPLALPVSDADIARMLPFSRAQLEDSRLRLITPEWNLDIPLDIGVQRAPTGTLKYRASDIAFHAGDINVRTGKATLTTQLDEKEKKWNGTWQIDAIKLEDAGIDVPELTANGTLEIYADRLELAGTFKNADSKTRADFKLLYHLQDAAQSRLTITQAIMPWSEGRVALRNTVIPIGKKADIRLKLDVEHVSVDTLLQTLTGKQATGTGTVSGALPITLRANGGLIVDAGHLTSDGAGTIKLSPEAIPGDNEQVKLVRDILQNLQYSLLSVKASSGADNSLAVTLTLEGHNPDVYEGKLVKLNVQLTGDVLNFIQQGVMSLLDPKYFLKQGNGATNDTKKR